MHNRSTGAITGMRTGASLDQAREPCWLQPRTILFHAIDAVNGEERWQRSLGQPVPRSSLPCGNISPLGVTGTPVIDASTEAIYLNAAVEGASGPRHLVFALSLNDGTPLPGWPIDIMEALASKGQTFVGRDQNQRGALAILAGNLYVAFGGHFGDCGQYRGFVVGISFPIRELSSHGRLALVEGAFGRPAESAQMGRRCLSRPIAKFRGDVAFVCAIAAFARAKSSG